MYSDNGAKHQHHFSSWHQHHWLFVLVLNTNTMNHGVGVTTKILFWDGGVVSWRKNAKWHGVGVGVHHVLYAPSTSLVKTVHWFWVIRTFQNSNDLP